MADISSIKMPNGSIYDLKDKNAQTKINVSGILEGDGQGGISESDILDYDTDTTSGSVVSFTADGVAPLKSLTLSIDPVQDLHGYDAPWPGGGGANVLDPNITLTSEEIDGVTLTTTDGYQFKVVGTATGSSASIFRSELIPFGSGKALKAGTYSLPTGITAQIRKQVNGNFLANANGTFTAEEDFYVCQVWYIVSVGATVDLSRFIGLAVGSTAPTAWTPYSNICPISGWTEANVYDDPKHGGTVWWNQQFLAASEWKAHSEQSSVSVSDGVITATLISGTPNVYSPAITITGSTILTTIAKHKYYMACKFNPAADGFPYVRNNTAFPDAGPFGTQVTRAGEWGSYENIISATATGGPAWYLGNGGNTSQIQTGDSFSIKDLMCIDLTAMFGAGNEPATVEEFRALFPKDYYAYNAGEETLVSAVNGDPYRAVTIDLDGTRYGGVRDVVNGVLTVTHAEVDLGTLGWTLAYGRFNAQLPNVKPSSGQSGKPNILCSSYPTITPNEWYAKTLGITSLINGYIGEGYVGLNDPAYSDVASLKTALSGVQLVYELATPLTIPLTPQEISTLAGQNVLWADCGDIAVEYRKGENALLQDISEAIKNLQGKIRVSGLLKGDGNGNVTAAINGTDYSKVIIRDWSVT